MAARRLTPASYAVLGYLSITPMSGYDLTAAVRKSIDQFWQISKSQIYKELPLLEADELVTATHVQQDRYPDKRIYEITTDGKTALDTWLNSNELPSSVSRIPELLKLFFGHRMDHNSMRAMLSRSRQDHVDSVARFETLIEQLVAVPSARFALATARYGLLDAQMVVTWIDETLQALDVTDDQSVANDSDLLGLIRSIPPRPHDVGGHHT